MMNDDTNYNNNNNNFFKKTILKFLSSGKFILKFLLRTQIFIVRRKIRRTKKKFGKKRKNCKTRKKCIFCRQRHSCHLRPRNKLRQPW